MKSIWNGSISFGLVNIPIKLYSAVQSNVKGFRLLHKEHNAPINYKRVCSMDGKEVEWEDIVKGIEVSKNNYYIVTNEELDDLKPKNTDTVEIIQFIDSKSIDPIYFSKHYFAAPPKEDEKTYFLFKEVLQQTAKIAIGLFVMHDKEHVCAIESYKEGLLLTTLNYAYEIRDISAIDQLSSVPKLKKEELDLAKQLISRLYMEDFDISRFKDTFFDELQKLLKKKAKGQTIVIKEKPKAAEKEKNLVEALKASLK